MTVTCGIELSLPEADGHHLRDVLRHEVGVRVCLIDPQSNRRFQSQIIAVTPHVVLRVDEEIAGATQHSWVRYLLMALTKGDTPEWIAEKATELGVHGILFFQAERSVVRLHDVGAIQKKELRLQKIVAAAARQSNRTIIPQVQVFGGLAAALERIQILDSEPGSLLFCSLGAGAQEIRDCGLASPKAPIDLVVGPEGDFTERELAWCRDRRGIPVNLGPTVLRAETAAVASIAMCNAVFGWRGSSNP